jgi:SAM-dependent methyltransferase
MTEPPSPSDPATSPALSFGTVADAYARARPGYPAGAAPWLCGPGGRGDRAQRVLELGAGTGRLTAELVALGHQVLATDPSAQMLAHLRRALPEVPAARAAAERIPLPGGSVDVVVSGQAFHWFEAPRALPEIARVLRPGGTIALVWNERDERIPWARRLGEALGGPEQSTDPTHDLIGSGLFGYVEQATFRLWQPLDRERLRDLVRSRSHVALLDEAARARVLERVDALYDEYGRGADGMLLPYVTRCFKAVVRHPDPAPEDRSGTMADPPTDDGTDSLLIDFS